MENQPSRMTQVGEAIADQDDALKSLGQKLDCLIERLKPILQSKPKGVSEKPKEQSLCDLAMKIKGQASQVWFAIDRISCILEDIEL